MATCGSVAIAVITWRFQQSDSAGCGGLSSGLRRSVFQHAQKEPGGAKPALWLVNLTFVIKTHHLIKRFALYGRLCSVEWENSQPAR